MRQKNHVRRKKCTKCGAPKTVSKGNGQKSKGQPKNRTDTQTEAGRSATAGPSTSVQVPVNHGSSHMASPFSSSTGSNAHVGRSQSFSTANPGLHRGHSNANPGFHRNQVQDLGHVIDDALSSVPSSKSGTKK